MLDPIVTPPVNNDIPRTKEDWDKLRDIDTKRWGELTQARMDQAIREKRELQEKLSAEEIRRKNYETEIENLKSSSKKVIDSDIQDDNKNLEDDQRSFSRENLPQNDEEWDQLFIENPKLATDLRVFKVNSDKEGQEKQNKVHQEFQQSWRKCQEELWQKHPDMYVPELDAENKPKTDANGKIFLKIGPNGFPIPDLESEKGKLWNESWNEDPNGFSSSKIGPRLVMLDMERRLIERGKKVIAAGQSQQSQQGQGETGIMDQRGTMPSGVTPPISGKVSFASDDEKSHAEKAVQRGIYKSLSEYCALRDGKNTGIIEENRKPKFL